MFQKTIVVGRLTKDPNQFNYGQEGVGAGFTVAADAGRDKTTFYNAVAFGKNAENILKFFSKGRIIVIEGRMENDNREREQNGVKVTNYGMNLVVERWSFGGDSQQGGQQQNNQQQSGGYQQQNNQQQNGGYQQQNNQQQNNQQNQQPQQNNFQSQQNDFSGFNISDDDLPF